MGYWINHNIRAEGSKEDIEALASKLTQRRPKSLNDEGDIVWSEEEFSFYNIISPPEEMIKSGEWWEEEGNQWKQQHWQCYDAPAEEFDVFTPFGSNNSNTRMLTIRIDTKYDWPVDIFHELIRQYPSIKFSIWSEGEESEAIHITGVQGSYSQVDYPSPNSHADWESRGDIDSCWCGSYDNPDDWYEDCPRDDPKTYKVVVTHTHYVKALSMKDAALAVEAYDNNFNMPEDTEMVKYSIIPNVLAELVDKEEVK